jgi:hypothetical protein
MYNVDSSSKGATYFFQMNRHFVQYFQLCNHFQPFMFLHLSVETFFRVLLLKKRITSLQQSQLLPSIFGFIALVGR